MEARAAKEERKKSRKFSHQLLFQQNRSPSAKHLSFVVPNRYVLHGD